jgi:hypothetical protein
MVFQISFSDTPSMISFICIILLANFSPSAALILASYNLSLSRPIFSSFFQSFSTLDKVW